MKDPEFLGCIVGIAAIFIMVPLWATMCIGVLIASGAPTWCWVILWIYVPLSFFFQIVAKVVEAASK